MRAKRVIPRLVAENDLDQAFNYYLENAGAKVAEDFAVDFARTARLISEFPALGSPKHSFDTGLEKIRFWSMKKFPYLIFYSEEENHIDVWRVLHSHMNISEHLSDPDSY
jgi:toxin ParE1/3/4